MRSFKEFALQEIRKHPEIASALDEFERTKKIRKFTYRKRLDITIDENILKQFKAYCSQHGLNMSRVIESHLKEEIMRNSYSINNRAL